MKTSLDKLDGTLAKIDKSFDKLTRTFHRLIFVVGLVLIYTIYLIIKALI